MSWFDEVIGFFSPRAKFERMKYRAALSHIDRFNETQLRRYDGATKGRRTENWKTSGASANSEIFGSLSTLRNRSRDLIRNNPFAKRAQSVVTVNTVGAGIVGRLVFPEGFGKRQRSLIESNWERWSDNIKVDADGLHDLYGIQSLVMNAVMSDGEVLVRRIFEDVPGLRTPLRLQCLEGDFVDTRIQTNKKIPSGGGFNLLGIQFDARGNRTGYRLFKDHPGDFNVTNTFAGTESVLVPEREIAHVFSVDRPGQVRGVPWLSAAMMRLKDFDEYEQAQLLRQKIAACFSIFVTDISEPLTESEREIIFPSKVEPATIELLPPGRDIKFADPPGVSGYGEYQMAMLRAIAVSIGLTYEQLAGDLSNVNFSSGRMGWLEFGRNVDCWRWKIMVPMFLNRVWEWFKQASLIDGVDLDGVEIDWTPPAREMIDPTKEIGAQVDAIRAGIKSWPEVIRENGMVPAKVLDEISSTNKQFDDLGLVLDSDPRKTTKGGIAQADGMENQGNERKRQTDNGSN